MKRCGLLGEKLGHSYSPAIHAELADYEYRLYEVAPEKLGEFLTGGGFDGMNVTIPYKRPSSRTARSSRPSRKSSRA